MFRHTGELESLSAQQLVDCSEFNGACEGGLPGLAFEHIERVGGLSTEELYPYTGKVNR